MLEAGFIVKYDSQESEVGSVDEVMRHGRWQGMGDMIVERETPYWRSRDMAQWRPAHRRHRSTTPEPVAPWGAADCYSMTEKRRLGDPPRRNSSAPATSSA